MSYKLLYTKSAAKDIKKLDRVVKKKLKKKLEEFSKNPLLNVKRLTDFQLGGYRLRVGSYRVIFDLREKDIIILRIRHRKDVYKNK